MSSTRGCVSRTGRRVAVGGLLSWLVALAASASPDHPNIRPGLAMPTTYLDGGFDVVNAFNGNLTLRLPLGGSYPVGPELSFQLMAFYASNVWNRTSLGDEPFTDDVTSFLSGNPGLCAGCDTHNAGAGWRLSLGMMWPPLSPPVNTEVDRYLLIEPDGTRRYFYPSLHPGGPVHCDRWVSGVCEEGVYYTRDGSYLRATIVRQVTPEDALISAEVEDGRGISRHFNSLGQMHRLEDRYGNFVAIAHHGQQGSVAPHWQISDNRGRQHTVWFNPVGSYKEQHVDTLDLAAFGGNRLILRFHYQELTVPRPNSNPTTDVSVPVLVRVELDSQSGGANAGEYVFAYHDDDTAPAHSAAIRHAKLPTLGSLEWDYGFYVLGFGSSPFNLFNIVRGVSRKRAKDASGTPLGDDWQYDQANLFNSHLGLPGPAHSTQARTRVTTPAGSQTVYYFTIDDDDTLDDWRHGLPFTPVTSSSPVPTPVSGPGGLNLYLSSETWPGAVGSGTKVRRGYVRFTADPAEIGAEALAANRRQMHQRVYFDDDGGRFVQVARSDFDGLGHFRQAVTRGNFTTPEADRLTNLVGYNPANGAYDYDRELGGSPAGGFQLPSPNVPWVIETFDLHAVTAPGYPTTFTDYCFEPNTTFLQRRRLRSAGGLSPNDLVEVYDRNGQGLTTAVGQYGGDQALDAPTGFACQAPTGDPAYELRSTYQHGVLQTSAWLDTGGAEILRVVDQEIDQNTGLAHRTWDVSRTLATNYLYDRLSRLAAERPTEDAWTTYTHTKAASASSPARVHSFTRQNGQTSGTTLQESELRFDSLGRLAREEVQLPSGGFQRRDVLRNAQGWVLEVSEWSSLSNPLAHRTQFSEFDAFGRPQTIVPPDGANHRVNLTYSGVRELVRRVRIATDGGDAGCTTAEPDENCVEVTETYDELGRLRSVSEPSGAGGAPVATNYLYDGLGRLRSTSTANAGVTQQRFFEYDGRGLLVSERHPEKGAGNGWTSYCYDAGGNVTRRFESAAGCASASAEPFDVRFAYDRAQRLLQTTNAQGQLQQTLRYWEINQGTQHGKGKLEQATRFNQVALGGGITVPVTETYRYSGREGRVSERRTGVSGVGELLWWREGYTYDALGNVTLLEYPCRSSEQWQCHETVPALSHTYTRGYLTSIAGWLPEIAYHDNGMLAQVRYQHLGVGTNPIYAQAQDPNRMQRPASIAFNHLGPPAVEFPLSYDGVGNVKSWDAETYRYDPVSRLVSFQLGGPEQQDYGYDAFGNLLSISRTGYDSGISGGVTSVPASSATNRLTSGLTAYDTAGNLISSPTGQGFTYDVLGSLTSAGGEHYVYTADGERVGILDRDGDQTIWRLRDLGGQVLREYRYDGTVGCTDSVTVPPGTLSGTQTIAACLTVTAGAVTVQAGADVTFAAGSSVRLGVGFTVESGATFRAQIAPQGTPGALLETRSHVYALGYRFGFESSDAAVGRAYIVPNWLGSPRVVFDADDPTVQLHNNIFGFGERLPGGFSGSNAHLATDYLFTGHERDPLAGGGSGAWMDDLDHMHARSYWGLYGRFLSTDPLVLGPTRHPQSWNRYSYAYSNPTTFIDPLGLFGCVGYMCEDEITVTASGDGGPWAPIPGVPWGGGAEIDLTLPGGEAPRTWVEPGEAEGSVLCTSSMMRGDAALRAACTPMKAGMMPVLPSGLVTLLPTGQQHHIISRVIHRALEQHPRLAGRYRARDSRFVSRAVDRAAHRGYERWHRSLDNEVANWVRSNETATAAQFEAYLRSVYQRPDLIQRFPLGFQ